METAQKWEQAEHPFLRLENTKKARFCPFLYFKVPKRTKKRGLREKIKALPITERYRYGERSVKACEAF